MREISLILLSSMKFCKLVTEKLFGTSSERHHFKIKFGIFNSKCYCKKCSKIQVKAMSGSCKHTAWVLFSCLKKLFI